MTISVIRHAAAVELSFSIYPELRDQVAAWYVDGRLVDAGGEHTSGELLHWIQGRPLEAVYLGHSHEDHSGGVAALTAEGVPVYGSRGTAARLRHPERVPDYRALFWGQPKPVRVSPPPEGADLEPLPLPGHSPDQLGYLHASSGWLFSGDLILRRRQRFALAGEDPYAMMTSLRTVMALKPAALATGHRSLIVDPQAALAEQLGYLEDLAADIANRRGAGATVAEIVRSVLGGEAVMPGMGVTWKERTRGRFSGARWVRSFLSQSRP